MIFKLHYFCLTAGANALGILLGVYMANYTDATPAEIGLLYMLMPFVGMTFRPIICSYADRQQAHQKYLIACELLTAFSFSPFIIIPYLGSDFHENHPRFCWYFLVSFKVMGDIAFGGAVSIGDSLAINYATRIGTEFSTYRIFGTFGWMIFGFVVGQLNEIWFLPKYVAGFMVLILASLVDALACYLWPKEYFEMVTTTTMEKENEQHRLKQEQEGKKSLHSLTRSLMPKELVWAHAKKQLWSLVTLSCFCSGRQQNIGATDEQQVVSGAATNEQAASNSLKQQQDDKAIDKRVQIQTLFLLLRRDPRIIGYLFVFTGAGAALIPLSFFFMSLSEICHTQLTCDFSKLGGYLQVSMAVWETFLFLYIKQIVLKIGRLNSLSIAFTLAAVKYLFYGTLWPSVNPHWSLLSESTSGIIYGTFLTLMVETGHLFSTEVEHLIPELVQRGVISFDDEASREKLKLSLSATMQALIASANDGLGRGMGALIYGLIIDAYSYQTLWLVIGITMSSITIGLQLVNLMESCCNLKFGLDSTTNMKQDCKDLEMEIVNDDKLTTLAACSPVPNTNLSQKLREDRVDFQE